MQRDSTSKYPWSVRGFLPGRQRLRCSFANVHSQGARWPICIAAITSITSHQSTSPLTSRRSSRLRRCRYLSGLERTCDEEALDRRDLCVVRGDALGRQMWIVEAEAHDD